MNADSTRRYEPNPRQKVFHQVKPWTSEDGAVDLVKGYVGGLGGGKSRACEEEQIEICMVTPGGKSIALRKTDSRSDFSLIEDFQRLLGNEARWYEARRFFQFRNGHRLIVTPADKFDRFGSVQFVSYYIQEAQEIDYKIFDALNQRLRDPAGIVDGVSWYRGLFDARGMNDQHWITKEFIANAWNVDSPEATRHRARNPGWVYVRAKTDDNVRNLRPGYRESQIRAHPGDDRWKRVFIDGEIGHSVDGRAVFEEYRPDTHECDAVADPTLPILRGWDFGYRRPAVTFSQYTRDGIFVVLRELCPENVTREELVREVQAFQRAEFPDLARVTFQDFGDRHGEDVETAGSSDIDYVSQKLNTGFETRSYLIGAGHDVIRNLMTRMVKRPGGVLVAAFQVDKSCERLRSALSGGYTFKTGDDGEDVVDRKNVYKDVVDSVRYVCQIVAEEGVRDLDEASTGSSYYARY